MACREGRKKGGVKTSFKFLEILLSDGLMRKYTRLTITCTILIFNLDKVIASTLCLKVKSYLC